MRWLVLANYVRCNSFPERSGGENLERVLPGFRGVLV
jgi:hypothetical protein